MDAFISTAMHTGKEIKFINATCMQCTYIIELCCYRLNLVLVDTAKGVKEINDFFGVMEITYRFFSASTLRHDKLVNAQKEKQLKSLKSLDLAIHAGHAVILPSICTNHVMIA